MIKFWRTIIEFNNSKASHKDASNVALVSCCAGEERRPGYSGEMVKNRRRARGLLTCMKTIPCDLICVSLVKGQYLYPSTRSAWYWMLNLSKPDASDRISCISTSESITSALGLQGVRSRRLRFTARRSKQTALSFGIYENYMAQHSTFQEQRSRTLDMCQGIASVYSSNKSMW